MSYPFSRMPSQKDIITMAVDDYGWELRELPSMNYLYRKNDDGSEVMVPLKNQAINLPLAPSKVRQLCSQLGINTFRFGFDLKDFIVVHSD